MLMPASKHRSAIAHLRSVDPTLGKIIDRVGPCRLEPRRTGTHYDALVRSIVFQQLSGRVAELGLWDDDGSWRDAEHAVDAIAEKYGRSAVRPAALLGDEPDRRMPIRGQ